MKRLWAYFALAFLVSIAPIPEKVWAQSEKVFKVVSVDWIWPETLRGQYVNIRALAVNDSGHIFAATTASLDGVNAYIWRYKDSSWQQLKNGLEGKILGGGVFAIAVVDSGHILAGTWDEIYKSTDNGESWQMVKVPEVGNEPRPRQFIRKPDGTLFCASMGYGVFRSTDNGNSWQQKANGISDKGMQAIAITPDGTHFAGNGSADFGFGVWRSTDNGENWVQVNNGLTNLNIYNLASPPSGFSQDVYAATSGGGLFKSVDKGESWHPANGNLTLRYPLGLGYTDLGLFVGFGAGDVAVYRTVTGGLVWENIPGLEGQVVWCFAQLSDHEVLVGSYDGVWLITFDLVVPVEPQPDIPTAYALSQNYPNPFNPSTTIEFSLPERTFVTLKITNILGQEIETLAAGEKELGNHRFVWNASQYPSGVYWYKLNAGTFTQTKKMLLMK